MGSKAVIDCTLNPFLKKWGRRSDSEWLQALISSCEKDEVEGVRFPTFPEEEIQRTIHGNSREVAVRGSMQFFRYVRDAAQKHSRPVGVDTRLLDFGSGWGRMVRPFMRDMSLDRIYAVEPSAEWCRIARYRNPYVGFVQSDYMPPLPFRNGLFDHVIAYSIFTHLPEAMFDVWMEEFARVTCTGGMVVFTFLGDGMMRTLDAYPDELPHDGSVHFWHRILLNALRHQGEFHHRYDDDRYIFLRTHQSDTYGDALISPTLLKRKVGHRFDIVEIADDALAQDVVVVVKR